MSEVIAVTFRDGAFYPDEPVDLPNGTRGRLYLEESAEAGVDESPSPNIDREQVLPADEAIAQFLKLSQEHPIHSGLRLTRDELHERD